jgi:hypothetical protein
MGRYDESGPALPPKIEAAFKFLHHARLITEQVDASISMRGLTALEKSVEAAALRAVQQYLLGEMDFVEHAPAAPRKKDGDDDAASEPVNSTQ